jgi:hypothetical protein
MKVTLACSGLARSTRFASNATIPTSNGSKAATNLVGLPIVLAGRATLATHGSIAHDGGGRVRKYGTLGG